MAPRLIPGDRVLALSARPKRGRLIFFPHPHRADFWMVKRIVGLPDEKVAITGGKVVVDGQELAERWTTGETSPDGAWDLPPGHVFVLSDARHRTSADSRTLGPVPLTGTYRGGFRYRRARR